MTVMTNNVEKEHVEPVSPDEIDLIEVFRKIWDGRKTIYKTVAVFFVLGLIIALGTPKEYKSETTLLVESQAKSGGMSGMLAQVAGLSGLNLGGAMSQQDALSPQLYPDVIKSTPFLLEVMNQKVTESKYDSTLTVAQYLERRTQPSLLNLLMGYTIGLPGKIIKAIKGKGKSDLVKTNRSSPLRLTERQSIIASTLTNLIKVKEGETNSTLVISIELQDSYVAAQLTDSVVKSLTHYIIDYRTHKTKNDLKFVSDRQKEAEVRYKQAQQILASYSDRNKNIVMASSRVEEQRLQSEFNLAFSIYNTLSQQLEQAKMKVQENTPVFTVIDPAKVALQKSKPKTSLILVGMVFLGGFLGVGMIFLNSLHLIKKS